MGTVPFPTVEEMFKMGLGMHFVADSRFTFPDAYKRELKEKFPTVRVLHDALDRNDPAYVRDLLSAYLTKLAVITPQQVLLAAEEGKLEELVDRSRQAVEFEKYCEDLEVRYFPERIEARRKEREEALASWE